VTALGSPSNPNVAAVMARGGLPCPPWFPLMLEGLYRSAILSTCVRFNLAFQVGRRRPPIFGGVPALPGESSAAYKRRAAAAYRQHHHHHWRRPGDRQLPAKQGRTLHRHVDWFFNHYVLGHSLTKIAITSKVTQRAVAAGIQVATTYLTGLIPPSSPLA
jgi:hypothetical protein